MTEDGRQESTVEELSLADEELNAADALLQAEFARVSLHMEPFDVHRNGATRCAA